MNTSEKIALPDGGYFLVQIEDAPAPKSGGIETTSVAEYVHYPDPVLQSA